MKQVFRLEGLGCAHCAAKMEKAVGKLDGVSGATVNFMTAKMVIVADDDKAESVADAAARIIKKIEPDVVVKRA